MDPIHFLPHLVAQRRDTGAMHEDLYAHFANDRIAERARRNPRNAAMRFRATRTRRRTLTGAIAR